MFAAPLALLAPYATAFAALAGWAVGALLAAVAVPRTGQAMYVVAFAVHVFATAAVVWIARWRAAAL